MRRITGIGQYIAGDSALHRLDPAAKIGIAAAFTFALFSVDGFVGLAVTAGLIAAAIAISHVPPGAVARGLRAVAMIMLLTVLANALQWQSADALFRVGPVAVEAAGLRTGVFFAIRIVLLVMGTSLLTLTTSPVRLADGIERVLSPLKILRVPVGDLAMTLTIALRFIPTTAEEAENIMIAQQARGASFDAGGPATRARAYAPVLVPLFFQLFRRADALATAMEARCYRGSEGRTRLVETRMGARDWTILAGVSGLLVCVGWLL